MAIEKKLNLSLEEISNTLGISSSKLIEFLSNHANDQSTPRNEVHSALSVLDEYHNNLNELVKINKRSKETWTTYNNFIIRIRTYLNENCPNLLINEFNEIILNKIIRYNSNREDFSTNTMNKYYSIIKSIMTFAFEMNYTQKNLNYKFKLDQTTLIPRYIKDEELIKILEVIKKFSKPYRCQAMIIFLIGTGCRVSEISKIKVKNFDIENDIIFIDNGKGAKDRYIPMFPEVKAVILDYLKKSGMDTWSANCEGYLFSRDEDLVRKRNFPIRTIEHLVERIRNKIPNLNHITPHSFRHTFAVKCLKMEIPSHSISLMLGHTDPRTTRVYTQLYNKDLKELITNKFPFPFEKILHEVILIKDKINE